MKANSIFIIFLTLFAVGCSRNISSGYSIYDKNYFMEPPRIEVIEEKNFLKWRYGNLGFYFQPHCESKNNELHCSLQGTSSSGSLSGQFDSIEILDQSSITAIKARAVYWLEPSGSKVKLVVVGA